MDKSILLIRTGGTIDAQPYSDPKNPPQFVTTLKGKDSLVMPTVATLPHHEEVDGFSWIGDREDRFVKDSQQYLPEDIKALADIIKSDTHRFFVLTHGTSDMTKNAALLAEALKGTDKVVAFAGAIVPLSMHAKHTSDGVEALRFALEHVTEQSAGVHVIGYDAKTKRLGFFDPRQVEKDRVASLADLKFMLNRR